MVEFNQTTHIKTKLGWLSKTNKEDWDILIEAYQKGSSIVALSKSYSISETTIKKYLKSFGIDTRTRSKARINYTLLVDHADRDNQNNEMYLLLRTGTSLKDLSIRYGKSVEYVRSCLTRVDPFYLKYTVNIPRYAKLDWNEIYSEYMRGVSLELIAGKYSIHKKTVLKYFNTLNLPLRTETSYINTSKGKFDRDSKQQWLEVYQDYIDNYSMSDLAKAYKLSPLTLINQFEKFNLPLRTLEEIHSKLGELKVGICRNIKDFDLDNKEHWVKLHKEYLENSLSHLVTKYNTSDKVIKKYFSKFNLQLKTNLETRRDIFLNGNTQIGGSLLRNNVKSDWENIHREYISSKDLLDLEGFKIKYGLPKRTLEKHFKRLGFSTISKGDFKLRASCRRIESNSENILAILKEKNLTLLEEYKGYAIQGTHISYALSHLDCGKTFQRTLHDISSTRCPFCNRVSTVEVELVEYINSMGYLTKKGLRNIIPPQELDIFIPKLNIAFEYNGAYWHSTVHERITKHYHSNKTDSCSNKNIRLYHIWDYDDLTKIKSLINQKLNHCKTVVYARKLLVKKVTVKERREFFNSNHLHGDVNSTFALGLYNNEELVQCISFRSHKEGIEIARFATKLGLNCTGGFTRLLKHGIIYIKDTFSKVSKIVSYCDRDWTPNYRDSVYFKNGFTFKGNTGSILRYYNSTLGKIESREKYQKHKLMQLFPDMYSSGKTADEILIKKNIYPIYNSGNWKFERLV